ncbi:MAG TPA: hypothetical protein VGG23_01720, partial [Acidimicrobiales bacterium]
AAVDGEPDAAVAAHLLVCLSCREQVGAWKRSLGQLSRLGAVDDLASERRAETGRGLEPDGGSEPGRGLQSRRGLGAGRGAGRLRVVGSRRDGSGRAPVDRAVAVAMEAWRPPARTRRSLPLMPVAAAVAVIVLVAAVVVGVTVSRSGSGASSATAGSAGSASQETQRHASAAAGAPSATSAVMQAGGRAALVTDLRRVVPPAAGQASVASTTPCFHAAQVVEARAPAAGSTAPAYQSPVVFEGITGRVYVFAGSAGYVALVLRSGSCALLATVDV